MYQLYFFKNSGHRFVDRPFQEGKYLYRIWRRLFIDDHWQSSSALLDQSVYSVGNRDGLYQSKNQNRVRHYLASSSNSKAGPGTFRSSRSELDCLQLISILTFLHFQYFPISGSIFRCDLWQLWLNQQWSVEMSPAQQTLLKGRKDSTLSSLAA